MKKVIKMPYDLYEYLLKRRNDSGYVEVNDIVRENIWGESLEDTSSKTWIETELQVLIDLYVLLRYT